MELYSVPHRCSIRICINVFIEKSITFNSVSNSAQQRSQGRYSENYLAPVKLIQGNTIIGNFHFTESAKVISPVSENCHYKSV